MHDDWVHQSEDRDSSTGCARRPVLIAFSDLSLTAGLVIYQRRAQLHA